MDSESLAKIQQIVTAATETIEARLGDRIAEVQRHTGVLIEDVHHKLALVIEGQYVLHREIANVRTEIQQESQETRALIRPSYQ